MLLFCPSSVTFLRFCLGFFQQRTQPGLLAFVFLFPHYVSFVFFYPPPLLFPYPNGAIDLISARFVGASFLSLHLPFCTFFPFVLRRRTSHAWDPVSAPCGCLALFCDFAPGPPHFWTARAPPPPPAFLVLSVGWRVVSGARPLVGVARQGFSLSA